jgi:hypothetical protein
LRRFRLFGRSTTPDVSGFFYRLLIALLRGVVGVL